MTDDPIRAIEARLAAITPGPWDVELYEVLGPDRYGQPEIAVCDTEADAAFIAAAPADLRFLLDEVARLRAALNALLDAGVIFGNAGERVTARPPDAKVTWLPEAGIITAGDLQRFAAQWRVSNAVLREEHTP